MSELKHKGKTYVIKIQILYNSLQIVFTIGVIKSQQILNPKITRNFTEIVFIIE